VKIVADIKTSKILNPDYYVTGLMKKEHSTASQLFYHFRKTTEIVLSQALDDATVAGLRIDGEDVADEFAYASDVVAACRRALEATNPEDILEQDKDMIWGATWAFIL